MSQDCVGLRFMRTNSNWNLWWEFEEISREMLLKTKDYHIEDDEELRLRKKEVVLRYGKAQVTLREQFWWGRTRIL